MTIGRKKALFMALAAGSLATVASAQSITTLFATNNAGSAGGIVFFNITVGPSPITVTSLDVNTASTTNFGFSFYTVAGGYAGHETVAADWTLQTNGSGTPAGTNLPSHVVLNSSVVLAANTTYGVGLVLNGGGNPAAAHSYTNGTGANQMYANADLTLNLGEAQNVPFTGTPFTPRVWNGTINYTIGGVTGACCLSDGSCTLTTQASCSAAGGIYRGDNSPCATANCPQPPTGACCFSTDGHCFIRTQAQCTSGGGVYGGNNSTCSTASCTPPGACCFSDGSCAVVPQSQCINASGTYHGNGSVCATAGCWTLPVLWDNAKIITHPGQGANGADASQVPTGGATIGENQNLAAGVRVADDFTIPTGQMWTINRFITEGYQTGSTTTSTFTQIVVRIWDRNPTDPNAVSLFGDITTNLIDLNETAFSNIYRVTTVLTDTARPVMKVVADLPNVQLPAGTYWVEWSTTGSGASGPFIPLVTLPNFLPTGNAVIWRNVPWAPVVDTGINTSEYPGGQPVDLPFLLLGTSSGGACYPNCDGSTSIPFLNVNDFICFQGRFAAGDSYANCDGSTSIPVLNVNDFICFQGRFAAGCSAP